MSGDLEHIVELNSRERECLMRWLERPNGSHRSGRVNFEAVVGGGILVRTLPYSYPTTRKTSCVCGFCDGEDCR